MIVPEGNFTSNSKLYHYGGKMEKENVRQSSETLGDQGIIFISGTINEGISEDVCRQILEINIKEKVDHIQMIINSSGGAMNAGFAIIDMMEWSSIPVYTIGIGIIASMGLMIFMAGEKGRRVITPRTSILSHRFSWVNLGHHSQLVAARKEEDLAHERIVAHYQRYTRIKDRGELESTLLRDVDTWLSPGEALKYGIADIIEPGRRQAL